MSFKRIMPNKFEETIELCMTIKHSRPGYAFVRCWLLSLIYYSPSFNIMQVFGSFDGLLCFCNLLWFECEMSSIGLSAWTLFCLLVMVTGERMKPLECRPSWRNEVGRICFLLDFALCFLYLDMRKSGQAISSSQPYLQDRLDAWSREVTEIPPPWSRFYQLLLQWLEKQQVIQCSSEGTSIQWNPGQNLKSKINE